MSNAPARLTPRLVPVSKWATIHGWPSEAALRYYIFHAETNGFDRVIKRVGRRVLIDEANFFEWVDERTQEAG